MFSRMVFWLAPAFLILFVHPAFSQNRVHLFVEQSLYSQLRSEIEQYADDLQREGYTIAITSGSWKNPQEVRTLLAADLSNGLVGTVLIGNIPLAQFNLASDVNDGYWHNFYTLLYYMDLDGVWGGLNNGVYTSHSGDTAPEIWAGVIRADNLPAAGSEVELLRSYFQRVHQYRRRQLNFPRFRAFQFYHTILPNYANLAAIYSDITDSGCNSQASQLRALFEDPQGYDFAVINTASGYSVHHFHPLADGWPLPDSYWVTDHGADDVDYRDVLAADPQILFYHLATSETGRFDQPNNLSGTYVFGTSRGLVALAATQHAIIGDTFYEPLAQGKTFGEAFQTDLANFIQTFQSNGYSSTEWCPNWGDNSSKERLTQRFYSAILLGDPTLRINRDNRVDNLPPIIDSVQTSELTQTSVTITWQTDEPADSRVEYGTTTAYGQTSALQSALGTYHSVQLTGLTPGTMYHFRVISKDSAGNTAVGENLTFTTPGDVTPPGIAQITVTNITAKGAVISWQTDEPADTQTEWGPTTAYGYQSPLDTVLKTSHQVALSGLQPNTLYHFRVLSRDASGNLAVSSDQTFQTLPDTTAPLIQNILVQIPAPTRAVVSWTTDEPADGTIDFGTTPAFGQTRTSTNGLQTVHQVELNPLIPETTYYYRIRSRDAYGNLAVTDNFTFITPPDTIPPIMQNVRIENIGLRSAEIAWETDEPADSRVQWGTTRQYGATAGDSLLGKTHRLLLRDLEPNTMYHVRASSRDTYGNEAVSENLTFRTLADLEPPEILQLRIADVKPGMVTLVWNTDEPASAAVRYGPTPALDFRLQSSSEPALTHQLRIESLNEGRQYHFAAEATDLSGNVRQSTLLDMMIPAEFPDFSQTVETESMAIKIGGNPAGSGTWQMRAGEAVADSIEVPADDTYHFWLKIQADRADNGRRLQCLVDGVLQREFTLFSDSSGYFAFRTFLARGRHEIRLVVPQDASGAVLADRMTVQSQSARQVQPLVLTQFRVDSVFDTRARLVWETSLATTAVVRYGPVGSGADSIQVDTSARRHAISLSNLRPATRYHTQITVKDTLGRTLTSERLEFTTLNDQRAPVLLEVHALNVGPDFAVIQWRADEAVRASVEYGEDEGLGRQGPVNTNFITEASDTLRGLLSNTHYFYRITLVDRAGNRSVSSVFEFLTHPPVAPDPQLIVLEAENMAQRLGGQITDDGAGWRFVDRGSLADSIQIQVSGTYAVLIQARGRAADDQWPIISLSLDGAPFAQLMIQTENYQTYETLIDLMAGRYQIALSFINPDAAGNARMVEVDWLKIHPQNAAVDRLAPQISAIQIEALSASDVLVRWWSSEVAHGALEFGHTSNLGKISRDRTRSTMLHEIKLQDIEYDLSHYFRIRTWDDHGNVSISSIQDFVLSEIVSGVEPQMPSPEGLPPGDFYILGHHPNPVRERSTIQLQIPNKGRLQLKIYDILGREVAQLFSGNVSPGIQHIVWEPSTSGQRGNLRSGVYFIHARYRSQNGLHRVVSRRVLLLK